MGDFRPEECCELYWSCENCYTANESCRILCLYCGEDRWDIDCDVDW